MNQPCLIMLFKFFFTASNLSVAVSFFPVLSPWEILLCGHLYVSAINRLLSMYLLSACVVHLYWKDRTCVCIQKEGGKQNTNLRFLSHSQCCFMLSSLRSNVQMIPCRYHSWPWKSPFLFSSSFMSCCGFFPGGALCATWNHPCFDY